MYIRTPRLSPPPLLLLLPLLPLLPCRRLNQQRRHTPLPVRPPRGGRQRVHDVANGFLVLWAGKKTLPLGAQRPHGGEFCLVQGEEAAEASLGESVRGERHEAGASAGVGEVGGQGGFVRHHVVRRGLAGGQGGRGARGVLNSVVGSRRGR